MARAFTPVSDAELDMAIEYAKEAYGVQCLDKDLLRQVANEAVRQFHQTPRVGFAFIAAKAVRAQIRARTKEEDDKVQAFKGAVAKIGNFRRHMKHRKKLPSVAAVVPSRQRFPISKKGQYILL